MLLLLVVPKLGAVLVAVVVVVAMIGVVVREVRRHKYPSEVERCSCKAQRWPGSRGGSRRA